VRRLEESGVILGYHARIAPAVLDQTFEVIAEIQLTDHSKKTVDRFEAALAALEPVIEARRMFGAPDYHARVAVADLAAYERFVTDDLMALPGLARLESRFPMKTIKTSHM
jgi:DNA-binding Lrp family transcriptional regulator